MARGHGEGTLVQRRDGRWQASLQVEGKRRTVYGSTKAEARRKLGDLKRQAASGSLPEPGRRTLADLLGMWLESSTPNWKPRTVSDNRAICDRYILPTLGRVRLSRLEPAHIQRLCARYQAEGKNRTALKVYVALHKACALGVLWRWLPENPCERVVRPQYQAPRKDVWAPEELACFLAGTEEHWLQPLWVLLLTSGCRLGEALALTWDDVRGNVVSVNKAGQHIRGIWTVTAPKTQAGTRNISLPPEGVAALKRQRVQQLEQRLKAGTDWQDSALVFTGETGKPLQGSVVAHALRRECHRLGVPSVTPHGLRHLHASLLLSEGLPLPEVSRRLGHATSQVTASIYAHVIGQDDSAATAAIARAIARG